MADLKDSEVLAFAINCASHLIKNKFANVAIIVNSLVPRGISMISVRRVLIVNSGTRSVAYWTSHTHYHFSVLLYKCILVQLT